MNKFTFTKLPNNLLIPIGEEKSVLQLIGNDKVLSVLDYLYLNTNRKGIVNFTLEHMIVESGLTVNINKGKSVDQFRFILSSLQRLEIIKSDYNFNGVKPKEFISCSLELDLESSFFILDEEHKELILNQTIDKIDNLKLLTYYCYLKARMYKRSNNNSHIQAIGGRAEIAFPSFETIQHDLGLSDSTIDKYNNILVKLNLIRIGNAGLWYYNSDKNKILKESTNIYVLFNGDEESTQYMLNEGVKYYIELDINSNKVFTNKREYKNNNRKLNGLLGSIIKKEINGTATANDLVKKEEILASKQDNSAEDRKLRIKALFDKQESEYTLSQIYFKMGNESKSDKILMLEEKLGLIVDEELVVEFDYYKWVMTNVNKETFEYYKNCVSKHKQGIEKPKGLQPRKSEAERYFDEEYEKYIDIPVEGEVWGCNYDYHPTEEELKAMY